MQILINFLDLSFYENIENKAFLHVPLD